MFSIIDDGRGKLVIDHEFNEDNDAAVMIKAPHHGTVFALRAKEARCMGEELLRMAQDQQDWEDGG